MAAQSQHKHGHQGAPVPRDLPDQQARPGEDPWEAASSARPRHGEREPDPDVPDTDEAGTGPRGAPRQATVHSDHPTPDEPTG
ncbi:hypothetical protein [Streptomyces sp. NPDC006739]|uniref:hypothetical protein n=1 Tax=Streptomyces sp. NPDC006739 TaxID=3364763 RepID=UPI00369AB543